MPQPNQAALDFLLSRSSRPAKTLKTPVPTRDQLLPILTAAARVPDHGKLVPWRFVVLERAALLRLADLVRRLGPGLGIDPEKVEKSALNFGGSHLAVAVVFVPRDSEKVPEVEQLLSAGAACFSLLNAALASGWGANWITGWPSHDEGFCREGFGLAAGEKVAGIIHIGTETSVPPERPRPDVAEITTWMTE
ncbi:nitroreductase [Ostreiculturibacter nitratireducens]|uniref:nitroreductase family protein n=1 Tax=Ostreiculturibacter nitratireducens TaxID=3075226 RepID=UPI0031B61335